MHDHYSSTEDSYGNLKKDFPQEFYNKTGKPITEGIADIERSRHNLFNPTDLTR